MLQHHLINMASLMLCRYIFTKITCLIKRLFTYIYEMLNTYSTGLCLVKDRYHFIAIFGTLGQMLS